MPEAPDSVCVECDPECEGKPGWHYVSGQCSWCSCRGLREFAEGSLDHHRDGCNECDELESGGFDRGREAGYDEADKAWAKKLKEVVDTAQRALKELEAFAES